MIEDNEVDGALGVGIFCGDFSECEIEDNTISNVSPDLDSDDQTRLGVAIQAHRGAEAELKDNEISASPGGIAAFVEATIHHRK
jgi:parallel beta-helix repeat protein